MNTTEMIYRRIAGDPWVMAALAPWKQGAAIFNDRAPDGFVFDKANVKPCVVISAAGVNRPDDTFTEFGRYVEQDVRLYQFDTGSSLDLDSLAERVRKLFHAKPDCLTIHAAKIIGSTVSGPVPAPTSDASVIGRRLTLRLTIEECS